MNYKTEHCYYRVPLENQENLDLLDPLDQEYVTAIHVTCETTSLKFVI